MSFCFLFLLLSLSGLVDFSSSFFFTWFISFCLTSNISINSFITSFSNSYLLICLTILSCLSHCFLVCLYPLHLWQIIFLVCLSFFSLSYDSVLFKAVMSLFLPISKGKFKIAIFLANFAKPLLGICHRFFNWFQSFINFFL